MTKCGLLISFILRRTEQNEGEMESMLSSPDEPLGLTSRMKKFFVGFATGAEGRSHSATNITKQKNPNLSSITTPSDPWIYTVVPWED
jgi:hypothetical protein